MECRIDRNDHVARIESPAVDLHIRVWHQSMQIVRTLCMMLSQSECATLRADKVDCMRTMSHKTFDPGSS